VHGTDGFLRRNGDEAKESVGIKGTILSVAVAGREAACVLTDHQAHLSRRDGEIDIDVDLKPQVSGAG
jgi:hypothetical protein